MTPDKKNENPYQVDDSIDNFEINYVNPNIEENIEEEPPIYNNWDSSNDSHLEFYPKRKEGEVIIGTIKVPI